MIPTLYVLIAATRRLLPMEQTADTSAEALAALERFVVENDDLLELRSSNRPV